MQEADGENYGDFRRADSKISKPGGFYASLGEPYTLDMVYVLEYEVLTDDEVQKTLGTSDYKWLEKLRQQGTEPWSDDRWTGGMSYIRRRCIPFRA